MPDGLNINVTQTGRVRGPNLSDPQLRAIGEQMVQAQKDRWASAINASGNSAKPLSKKYAALKEKEKGNAVRNMYFTGATAANFSLRRAAEGKIRAENTTRAERLKAQHSQQWDQMIGFAVSDVRAVMDESKNQYGDWVNKAWIPVAGTRGAPRR